VKRSSPVPICLHYVVLAIVATAAATWESVSGEPGNRFRERCSRNAWRDRITSAYRLCRSSLPSSTGRGASELWHRFSFLLSTRTTVAVAVIFGLCIILNVIHTCHKICKMFRCMWRYGVCCVSCALVMHSLMCSLQWIFFVRQYNVNSRCVPLCACLPCQWCAVWAVRDSHIVPKTCCPDWIFVVFAMSWEILG
jgi:hypothetical protein